MRSLFSVLLAGAAAVGFVGAALADGPQTHVLTVRLPGGAIEQIRYTGNVAPQVVVAPAPVVAWAPVFAPDPAFAALDRISTEMYREAASLMRQAQALAAAPPAALTQAALANLPAGSQSYTFVSTMSGNGVCMRSTQITARGDGQAPQVVTHTSGNCSGSPASPTLPTAQPPAPAQGPEMLQTRATGAHPYAGLIREATWQH